MTSGPDSRITVDTKALIGLLGAIGDAVEKVAALRPLAITEAQSEAVLEAWCAVLEAHRLTKALNEGHPHMPRE